MHRVRIRLLLREAEPARAFVRLLLAGHFARSPGAPVKTCALQHEDPDNTPQAGPPALGRYNRTPQAFKKSPVNPQQRTGWDAVFAKRLNPPLTAVDHVGTICYAATAFTLLKWNPIPKVAKTLP